MATLICHATPELRIFIPATGEIRRFSRGRLDIEEDDPAFPVVMAQARENPTIYVVTGEAQCEWCGATFDGSPDRVREKLDEHVHDVHFDKWAEGKDAKAREVRMLELKARAGYACDACRPAQVFGDEDSLLAHNRLVHMAIPVLGDEGEVIEESTPRRRRRPGEVEIPAAKPSKA